MTNIYESNSASILGENNFRYLISDILQEPEELDDTVSNEFAVYIRTIRKATACGDELLLDHRNTYHQPVVVGAFRSLKPIMVSPQIEEGGFRWGCVITEKNTPYSHISYRIPYTVLTEKPETFSPDFHDIRNMARLLLQPASTQLEDEIPEILAVSEASQVIEEAKAEKIELDLEIAIGLIREIYSTLKEIKLSVKYDPEIEGRKTFCFDLTVSGGVDAILKDESLFKQNLLSNVSDRACELIVIAYDWER